MITEIISIIFVLLLINLVVAGSGFLKEKQDVGSCYKGKTITAIVPHKSGYKVTYTKGCTPPLYQIPVNEEKGAIGFIVSNSNSYDLTGKCIQLQSGHYNIFVEAGYDLNIVRNVIEHTTPFNEFTWSIYQESDQYACRGFINESKKDFRVYMMGMSYYAYAKPSVNNEANEVLRSYQKISNETALLMHELGHNYMRRGGHTNDTSVMDNNMGKRIYLDYQVDIIRRALQ